MEISKELKELIDSTINEAIQSCATRDDNRWGYASDEECRIIDEFEEKLKKL